MPDARGLNLPGDGLAPLPRAVVREAAQWLMRLHAGQATEAQRAALAQWRNADPVHERAWQRAEQLSGKLGLLPPDLGLQVLDRPRRAPRRRTALQALLLVAGAVPTGYLAWRATQPTDTGWTAAHRTATGERRNVVLPDGTQLQLNTDTAIDVRFGDGGLRLLVLRHGEVSIETGADMPQQRPFLVETRHGRIRALGTRFVVRQLAADAITQVAVQQSAVEVRPANAHQHSAIVQAGLQTRFDANGLQPIVPADPQQATWTRGLLFASDQRLADFATELGRYRPGLLRCAPEVAELRISGVFRLDDTDAILDALPHTLPVHVAYRTRWWVRIAAPPSG